MVLNLIETIDEFLRRNPEKKFTARQIAHWIFETYPARCRLKQKRSNAKLRPLNNDKALLTQIVAEVAAHRPGLQKRNPRIKTTRECPRKYYFSELDEGELIDDFESNELLNAIYPVLSDFLWSKFRIYSMRINEKQSNNSRGVSGNKWLYSSFVGVENLGGGYHHELKENMQDDSKKIKLWSFEVRALINLSNVRRAFFQAVSNSSWANFGYLVANKIEDDDDVIKELHTLSSMHGIGLIKLYSRKPSKSQIIIPAPERTEIDWETTNKLTEENKSFMEYMKLTGQSGQFH